MVDDAPFRNKVTNVTGTVSISFRGLPSCTMLTEPWIVELVSMALRTNTPPQPVERRNNERTGRRSEKRRFTNHLASEVYRQCRSCGGAPDPRKTTTDVAKLRSWRKIAIALTDPVGQFSMSAMA